MAFSFNDGQSKFVGRYLELLNKKSRTKTEDNELGQLAKGSDVREYLKANSGTPAPVVAPSSFVSPAPAVVAQDADNAWLADQNIAAANRQRAGISNVDMAGGYQPGYELAALKAEYNKQRKAGKIDPVVRDAYRAAKRGNTNFDEIGREPLKVNLPFERATTLNDLTPAQRDSFMMDGVLPKAETPAPVVAPEVVTPPAAVAGDYFGGQKLDYQGNLAKGPISAYPTTAPTPKAKRTIVNGAGAPKKIKRPMVSAPQIPAAPVRSGLEEFYAANAAAPVAPVRQDRLAVLNNLGGDGFGTSW